MLVLAGGTFGRRYALPHARVHLIEGTAAFEPHSAADLAVEARAVRDRSVRWRTTLLKHLRLPPERLVSELSAPHWLTAEEAQSMGIVDALATPRPRTA